MEDRGGFNDVPEVPGIVRALRVLRERWWIVLASAIACTAAALALSLSSEKQYDATSKLLFRPNDLAAQVGGASEAADNDPEATKATNVLLVTTTEVADAVRKDLDLRISTDDLLDQVLAEPEESSNIVNITVTDTDPALAARIANSWASQFVLFSRTRARAKVSEGSALVRERLERLPEDATTDRDELRGALGRLAQLEAVQTGDAEVVDRAVADSGPVSPKPTRDGAIALVLGSLLGVGLAFLLNTLDRRVKTAEDIEQLYGIRALTTIPERTREPANQRDRQAALEPFRILRNALGFLSIDRPPRVVMVTSAVPGEGKSTTAAGLARAIALAGQSVALVEADLRRPTFHQQFDLQGDPRGLTTAIVAGVPVREVVRTVLPGLRTLVVLPSGPTPPNSAELLRSAEMSRVLTELLDEVDIVVLDAPPLLPVADSQVLLDHELVDACLVVGRAYRTTREEIRRCRSVLSRHRQRNLGLVVNGLKELDSGYDYYGSADDAPGTGRLAQRA